MKKVTYLILLIIVFINLKIFAQQGYPSAVQKGTFFTGGDFAVGFFSNIGYGYENNNSKSYAGASKTGLFLDNGFLMGVVVDFTATTYRDYDSKETNTQFTLGPFIRYYTPEWPLFIHVDLTFGKMLKPEELNMKVTKFQVGFGYAFFFSKSVSIESSMMYRLTQYQGNDYDQSFRNINELVCSVGLSVFLRKK